MRTLRAVYSATIDNISAAKGHLQSVRNSDAILQLKVFSPLAAAARLVATVHNKYLQGKCLQEMYEDWAAECGGDAQIAE